MKILKKIFNDSLLIFSMSKRNKKKIIAFVGMPGAGKSEATLYLSKKGLPYVRFGELTDEKVSEKGLALNPQNEQKAREELRREFGMGAYAIKAKPKLDVLFKNNDTVIIDGLYSWGEYKYLLQEFPNLVLIHIYSEPPVRYKRLLSRNIRPFSENESRERDIAEIEKLDKGGPIAIADYLIENNSEDLPAFYFKLDAILERISIKND